MLDQLWDGRRAHARTRKFFVLRPESARRSNPQLRGYQTQQRDYAEFMGCVGFRTRLCKPRHPLAKGKVERLIRFARDRDFLQIGIAASLA